MTTRNMWIGMTFATLVAVMVAAPTRAVAQPSATTATPTAGSAATPTATPTAEPAAGTGDSMPAPPDEAPPVPAPPPDTTALRHACEAAVIAAKGSNNLFIIDVSNVAAGAMSRTELAKTPDGQGCVAAIDGNEEMRSSMAIAANEAAASERLGLAHKDHEDASRAIAKNEKHVILAYAALWLLAAGFVLFLWRRQQALRTEIGRLRRDLDAATK